MNVAAVLRLKGSFRHNALCNVDVSISLKFSKKKRQKITAMKKWLLVRKTQKKQSQESLFSLKEETFANSYLI